MKIVLWSGILIMVLLLPRQSHAQDSNDIRRGWISIGLGAATGQEALSANFSYQFSANLLSARGVLGGSLCAECEKTRGSFFDLGLLYGRSTVQKSVHASVSIGPAVTGDEEFKADIGWEQYITIGLAGGIQLFLHTPVIGIGLYSFGNIHSRGSFFGLTLNLKIGKLR